MERCRLTEFYGSYSSTSLVFLAEPWRRVSPPPRDPPKKFGESLEKLPTAEREKKLIEGAKSEGELLWYTNSGVENATPLYPGIQEKISLHQRHTFGAPRRARSLSESSPKPTPGDTWST